MRPPNEQRPLVGTERALQDQGKADPASVPDAAAQREQYRKALATLRAHAALRGLVLHSLTGGKLLLCRAQWQRECSSVEQVEQVLRSMGARL